ncbi:hypothetical protein O181_114603 [Austropuccinia psidii MF-1]|uniref:Uncharacterized protein n=1 Tax=Austropuccinia psidii MF-1 TaxID=1389203 RepID=A0A9Q3K530_9BASI|nr:hypothetical protein [Austropuccinia psidii MF-1]
MPSIRSGASYNPSSSSQKGNRRDYGRSKSGTEGKYGHIQSQPQSLQQCTAVQEVPDPCRSVEKLHEFLPDCEKVHGLSQYLQVAQWMASIDGKGKMMLLTLEWWKNNPPPPNQVAKTAPVASSSNYNVKKQTQAPNKGKGKAQAPKPYSQGYRIPKIPQDAMENVFQMARTMMELQKKEKARLKFQK